MAENKGVGDKRPVSATEWKEYHARKKARRENNNASSDDAAIFPGFMPNELFELILTHADHYTKAALFSTSSRVHSLSKSQDLATAVLKKYAAQTPIKTRGLDFSYAHEASLAGWILTNYQHFIEQHNEAGIEMPSIYEYATCFMDNQNDYSDWDAFKALLLKCHLFAREISAIFTAECLRELSMQPSTPQFQTLARLAPYHKYLIGEHRLGLANTLVPLHHEGVQRMLVPRRLNALELQLFNIYNCRDPAAVLLPENIPRRQAPLIHGSEEFKRNLQEKFSYDTWAKWIEWDKFFMVGGSVLNSVLVDGFTVASQDIDFFFTSRDYCVYEESVEDFTTKLRKVAGEVNEGESDSNYVRTRIATVDGKEIKFQFIWYDDDMLPDVILNIFDVDACQVGWNGEEVLATPACVQSFTTSTMLNYKLVNNQQDAETFLPRTFKYLQRGFTLLTPKAFHTDLLAGLNRVNQQKIDDNKKDVKCDYTGFLLNNDSMQVCKAFVALITGHNDSSDSASDD